MESIEQAIAAVRYQLNQITSSYYQPDFTNGAISAACLIEQAIAEDI